MGNGLTGPGGTGTGQRGNVYPGDRVPPHTMFIGEIVDVIEK